MFWCFLDSYRIRNKLLIQLYRLNWLQTDTILEVLLPRRDFFQSFVNQVSGNSASFRWITRHFWDLWEVWITHTRLWASASGLTNSSYYIGHPANNCLFLDQTLYKRKNRFLRIPCVYWIIRTRIFLCICSLPFHYRRLNLWNFQGYQLDLFQYFDVNLL
jgi:hypothetical protein